MNRVFSLALAVLAFWPHTASAHGTRGWMEERSGICLVAQYDDGEPMRFSEVLITASDGDGEFQVGRTDRNGLFLFSPDREGKWRLTVDDGMGHRLVLSKTLTADDREVFTPTQPEKASFSPPAKAGGAVAGISLLLGAAGLLYGLRQRNLRRSL